MERAWISLDLLARALDIQPSEAAALAQREHWPTVFRLHETVVLAPKAAAAKG